MKNKKYLAWLFSGVSINKTLTVHSFLINKLCENFEKIYFINMDKFKLYKDWRSYKGEFSHGVDNKFKVPNNIEIFVPKTIKDFENFMIGKELIAINDIGKFFADFKIHFLLAKHRIKHIQLQNIGLSNTKQQIQKNFFWKNLIFKFKKNCSYKLIVLLSNLKLVPKIQIRFTSSSEIIKSINNSIIKKILYKLKLFYVKELVLINSYAFDIYKKTKMEISENQIVLLDFNFNQPEIIAFEGNFDEKKIEKHYYYLNKLINNLSVMYEKKIIICIHPKDNVKLKKKYFPNLDVVQYETRENIYKAFLVLFFETSAIVDAILLKKRILYLTSNFFSKNVNNLGLSYVYKAGLLGINTKDEIKIDKNKLLSKLDNAKENYSKYIKSYIASDGNNIGYEKIIRTLKERFF